MSIELRSLTVGYGQSVVLRDFSVSVEEDKSLAVLGLNGVGKTTLLNTLMGLLKPSAGSIVFEGEDITSLSPDRRVRRGLAYVPQGRGGFAELTVLENLRVIQESTPGVPKSAIDDAIDIFPRLKPLLKRRAGVLSGGQQQQLSIARALTTRPKLLLLDEPTEGIQPSIIEEIQSVLTTLRGSESLQVIVVEQFLDFALALTDQYLVLEHGSVTRTGVSADLGTDEAKELLVI